MPSWPNQETTKKKPCGRDLPSKSAVAPSETKLEELSRKRDECTRETAETSTTSSAPPQETSTTPMGTSESAPGEQTDPETTTATPSFQVGEIVSLKGVVFRIKSTNAVRHELRLKVIPNGKAVMDRIKEMERDSQAGDKDEHLCTRL